MKKLVSICIPTYKQTEYLKKCLDSIIFQDFKNFELIISDDTPDDSVELFLKSYVLNLDYTYFRNNPSLGSPQNWNYAVSNAEGKYIKIMHHDDFFTKKDSLQLMVDAIEKQQASFLFCQTDVWDIKNNTHRIHQISSKQFNLVKQKPEFLFFKNTIGAPSVSLYINNKAICYDIEFKWLVDVDFYMQYLFHSKNVVYLPSPLIATSHGAVGQITGSVINDIETQIREHVLLYIKIEKNIHNRNGFAAFFDYLFFKFDIKSFSELKNIVPEVQKYEDFFNSICNSLPKNRQWKLLKQRFFESRYNNYIFKIEQFI
jgi:glycosyltransferase involved in cell wall biosynthesis